MKKTLTLLISLGILLSGCSSTSSGYYGSYYNPNSVSSIHQRFDNYEQNAHTASVYSTMNYNTNRGMGF